MNKINQQLVNSSEANDSALSTLENDYDSGNIRPSHLREFTAKPLTEAQIQSILPLAHKFLEEAEYVQGGMRETSWRKLKGRWELFVDYSLKQNTRPLPASLSSIKKFIEERLQEVSVVTVKSDIWAIDSMHHFAGFPKPCQDHLIKSIINRKQNTNAMREIVQNQATPLTRQDLGLLKSAYFESNNISEVRDLAMIALCFSCLLRSSELRPIKLKHINTESRTLEIPYSKTNNSGVSDFAPINDFAMNALFRYVEMADIDLDALESQEEYLFRRVNRFGTLNKKKFTKISYQVVRDAFSKGFEVCKDAKPKNTSPFSSHSCRVGACQELWKNNVDIAEIMKMGRWSTTETAYRYGRGFTQKHTTTNSILNPE